MTNVVPYVPKTSDPNNGGSGSGSGGSDMENRVSKLEQQFASIDAKLSKLSSIDVQLAEIKGLLAQTATKVELANLRADINKDFGSLKNDVNKVVSDLRTDVAQLPTIWQLFAIVLSVCGVGTGVVFTLLKFGLK
jgi:hypothetical protein